MYSISLLCFEQQVQKLLVNKQTNTKHKQSFPSQYESENVISSVMSDCL